jgi:hypothetical protein
MRGAGFALSELPANSEDAYRLGVILRMMAEIIWLFKTP